MFIIREFGREMCGTISNRVVGVKMRIRQNSCHFVKDGFPLNHDVNINSEPLSLVRKAGDLKSMFFFFFTYHTNIFTETDKTADDYSRPLSFERMFDGKNLNFNNIISFQHQRHVKYDQ